MHPSAGATRTSRSLITYYRYIRVTAMGVDKENYTAPRGSVTSRLRARGSRRCHESREMRFRTLHSAWEAARAAPGRSNVPGVTAMCGQSKLWANEEVRLRGAGGVLGWPQLL